MSEWLDQAVILRMGLFREADLWLRMLCREHGLFTIFAFGGAKSKKRFCGCLDILNTLNCRVKTSRNGFLNLQEAELREGAPGLRRNWQNLGMAVNCLRFVDSLAIGGESSAECFALVEKTRAHLGAKARVHRLFPLFFRLRLAAALGFGPGLSLCGGCSRPIAAHGYFLADEGRVFCAECAGGKSFASKKFSIKISRECLDILNAAGKEMPEGWRMEELSGSEAGACARLVDAFIQYHLGLAWENGYFRHV